MNRTILFYYFLFKYSILISIVALLGGIMYYIKRLNLPIKLQENLKEKLGIRSFLPTGITRRWNKIDSLLKEPYSSSWKLAVLQATSLVEQTLRNLGYKGETLKDFLQTLQIQKYRHLDLIEDIYQIREKIIQEKDFTLSKEEAVKIISLLRKFWQDVISQFI